MTKPVDTNRPPNEVQQMCIWLVEEGYVHKLRMYEKAKELFGGEQEIVNGTAIYKYEAMLALMLEMQCAYVVDNYYYPTDSLKKIVKIHTTKEAH